MIPSVGERYFFGGAIAVRDDLGSVEVLIEPVSVAGPTAMTGQPRPPEPGGDNSPADPGRGRKTSAKRVVLGTGETMILAGYVRRLCARIADTLVFGIAFVVLLQASPQSGGMGYAADFTLAALFVLIVNEVVAVASCGRTLDMQLFGIRLVSKKTGKKPSVIASFSRWTLQILPILFFVILSSPEVYEFLAFVFIIVSILWWLLVHLSVYLGDRRRGWHDLISGTVVVTADPPYPVEPPSGDTVYGRGGDTLDGGPDDDYINGADAC